MPSDASLTLGNGTTTFEEIRDIIDEKARMSAVDALVLPGTYITVSSEDSGIYIDPQRPDSRVPYTFEGRNMISKDVFTAIIQGLIIVAHDGSEDPVTYLTAVSALGNCTIHLRSVGPGPGVNAAYLLENLSRVVVISRRFQSMEFALEDRKSEEPEKWDRIIEGDMLGLGPPR